MTYLINEVFFLLLATACLSALLGRFLCKSNERMILAEKKHCQAELTQVHKQRDEWEIRSHQWQKKFADVNEQLASQTYATNSLQTQLEASEQEREHLLIELKKYDICKTKIASLAEELKANQTQLQLTLKKFDLTQRQVALLTKTNTELEEKLSSAKLLTDNLMEQHQALKHEHSGLQTHCTALKKIETEYYQLKEQQANLSEEILRLQKQYRTAQLELLSLAKLQAQYQQLLQDSKDLPALKKKVKQLLTERTDLTEQVNYLRQQLDSIVVAHNEQSEVILKLVSQRDSLLSRLQAVSSVVGAVGFETKE